jgi:CRISPR-associated protein Csm4
MQIGYVIIEFNGPFRVGKSGLLDAFDYVPSDTVYSALDYLRFMGFNHGIVSVSSAYPLIYVNDIHRSISDYGTVPIPMNIKLSLIKRISDERPDLVKQIRRINYLPMKCLTAKGIGYVVYGDYLRVTCGGEEFEYEGFGELVGVQRNVIGRAIGNADTFRAVAFMPTVRYIIYYRQPQDGIDVKEGERAFSMISELGIGGERSIGFGHFKVVESGVINYTGSGDYALILGTALPRVDSVEGYLNTTVRGWVCSPYYVIGPIHVIADGSVVPRDYVDFEVLKYPSCVKNLNPLWLPYDAGVHN